MQSRTSTDVRLRQASLEQASARRFLNAATWAIVFVLAAIAASVWLRPIARATGRLGLARVIAFGLLLEFLALIALVVVLRRRLAQQVDRAAAGIEQLGRQNAELEDQAAALEEQAVQLESQAEEARLLTRRLVEANRVAQLGYWEIDSVSGDVYWSDEMYRLAEMDAGIQPPPTDQFLDRVHPDDRPRMKAVAAAAISDLKEFTEQYRLMLPSGATRTIQAIGRVVTDDHGRTKLVGTVQDVSDRVELENQLRRAQKMEAVGQLAGGVAHDFNNVLTVIEGCTSILLASGDKSNPDRSFLDEIRTASRRAAALTRQLLAFSRQQVLQPRILDVNETIGGVEKMLARLIGEHIELHTKFGLPLDRVRADPNPLEQVLINLVVNARDAMADGGVLTIETANVVLDPAYAAAHPAVQPGPHVMLAVSDTGTGIAPATLERIFEPFFTTKESGRGTGLGLSTVHGIVQQSGGHVAVYSEVGRGSTFKVYLPRADSPSDAQTTTAAAATKAGTETILLVEDDAAVRGVAAAVLRRAGYRIIEAENGVEALRICQNPTVAFDLILSDMVMPGLGGRALAGHAKRSRPRVPVLLMSGYTRDAMIHSAELTPGSLFMEKPFTPEILTQKVREAIDRRTA